ncbi:transporter substrate-binding domain-containing protein [Parabacteroides acidifaciens]|uniref:Glutamine ABC transporter substrate-binding protein n=1 Tax=Parabacteroides acidifaciens TaxID=2290935 RepID=A0A3D8HED2_9BACT|nr:transporter substrate-binding domain-containing protein [Parabacteroides acidifaciens]MBC8601997.1 transporter substrate-binding domain-containing protein [Parabacteroides acidifaciens]RDU49333.1 glutamine ABC transporter substrate-binding protein [Parabacteroides acidifaciens]
MKSRKLIGVYAGLLIIAVATMIMLWRLKTMQKAEILPRDYPEIKQEGILRMVTEYNQSGYYVAGDTIEGFQYELSQAIAKLSGLEVQTHLEMSLAESFQELEKNKCDIIARNIPITSDIKEEYLFTEPIVLNKQVLVQRTEEANKGIKPLRNQLDLAGKTLYIPKDSPARLRLQNLGHEIGDTIYVVEDELYSGEQLAIMVAKGDIDYAVCDQQIATLSQKQLPEIDIKTDISFTQLQSWAVRKDSPILLDSLNSWLDQIRKNGTFNKIYKKYYQ